MRNVIQKHQNSFFFQKIAKKLPSSWGFGPKPPSVIRLSKLVCWHTSPNLHIIIFNFWFKLLSFKNSSLSAKPGHGFWLYILRYLCPTKSSSFENFWWRHCMSFLVWPYPQSKILATPIHGGKDFWAVPPQITACASQARVNFCISSRGPANFCPKTGHHKSFFSMKQQDRSRERDQVA